MAYWLLKSEPETYAWSDLCGLKQDMWDGVRNYQARNNIGKMRKGDKALFYHSGKERAIVGTVRVVSDPYADPTAQGEHSWLVVDVKPDNAFKKTIRLTDIRQEAPLKDMVLVKNPRLSVQPVTKEAFEYILGLGK